MKRILLITFMLVSALVTVSWAQTRSVTGTVTSAEDGSTLPGVNVILQGTTTGTVTDIDGNYRLDVPEEGGTLTFTFIGLATQEVAIGARSVVDVVMESDVEQLGEVVVTGVADATSRKKLAFSVGSVDGDLIQQVPATSPAAALQGKVAGVRINAPTGTPGQAPSIRLRGSTQITGSQAPLIIVDGAITEGTLADINVEDIERMEVIKGAAGASLYGSRAGNGVIQIITKRGKGMAVGETQVTFRTEYGVSSLPGDYPIASRHHYLLDADGNFALSAGGTVQLDPDGYLDNPWPRFNDHVSDVFDPGSFLTTFVSVGNRSEKTNIYASFQYSDQQGVTKFLDGYQRKNFKLNADHQISNKVSLSLSTLYSRSENDLPFDGQGGPFFGLVFTRPSVDLLAPNEEDGSPYNWDAGRELGFATETNPLYQLANNDRTRDRQRFIGNAELRYDVTDWLTLSGQYSIDAEQNLFEDFLPKGYLDEGAAAIGGELDKINYNNTAQNAWLNLIAKKTFGEFTTRFRASYLWENSFYEDFRGIGKNFPVGGIRTLAAASDRTLLYSSTEERTAENYFVTAGFDYKDRYIIDGLFRVDGSSLFGEDNRYRNFFRVSAAYRLSEDVTIPGVQEFKLRASYGTAGQRPSEFNAQYETYTISGGRPFKDVLGNKNLKPSVSQEFEVGVDVDFLDRFNLEVNYATTKTIDQILLVPLSANAGGYTSQWQNAGTLESTAFEVALGANIINTNSIRWDVGVVADRIRQKITEFGPPEQRTGPGSNDGQFFYIREGEDFGIMYGNKFVTNQAQLQTMGLSEGDYVKNSDGYFVPQGSLGTSGEAPIKFIDEEGNDQFVIGNVNPDFNMGFNSSFSWKNLSLFVLFDWRKGGDVYNLTKQWVFRENLHEEQVNSGKHFSYYQALYNTNQPVAHFVEDGSYLKLREANISYTLTKDQLGSLGRVFDDIRFSLIGRNLLTFTNYSGLDPEVSSPAFNSSEISDANNDDPTNFNIDSFSYPNFRTISGSIQFRF